MQRSAHFSTSLYFLHQDVLFLDDQCIKQAWVCDGTPDCVNGEDESFCADIHRGCGTGQFQCRIDGSCIFVHQICDGVKQCPDSSDEDGCSTTDSGQLLFSLRVGIKWIIFLHYALPPWHTYATLYRHNHMRNILASRVNFMISRHPNLVRFRAYPPKLLKHAVNLQRHV